VIEETASHLGRDRTEALNGLRILDVGCGGGLMSEALARCGAHVVGVDASPGNVAAARLHAESQNVTVDYRLGEPAEVLSPQDLFDVVLALEVVEHVSDVPAFLATAAARLAPGGKLFVSTIDRTFKSFAVAIVGAEYLLRVLPRGTHQWSMFVRPEELRSALASSELHMNNLRGMRYLPVVHKASWCEDTKVNYIATFTRTAHYNYDH
jgi:2-polyprenyl-6-hydroxyphenyl methylase/3-demethylubiquinone-9 3-methyltransferase